MTESLDHPSEGFIRFSRQKMMVLLATVIVVGAIGLALVLWPSGEGWRTMSRASLVPLAIVIIIAAAVSWRGRRWPADSPAVTIAVNDEWRRANMGRASRVALIVVLVAEYPLAILFGIALELPPPRQAFAMAFATMTVALATHLGAFLYFDRE